MRPRISLAALAALIALAACSDGVTPVAPRSRGLPARSLDVTTLAAAAKTTVLPTGKSLGIIGDTVQLPRTRYRIDYHFGEGWTYGHYVNFIWYGGWSTDPTRPDSEQRILPDLVTGLGGSPLFNIVNLYPNSGGSLPGYPIYAGGTVDRYSHGAVLSDADVADIMFNSIDNFSFPPSSGTIYVILSTPDVTDTSGFASTYCAFHGEVVRNGAPFHYIYVGSPLRSPPRCAPQPVGPNGTLAADAMASTLVAELANTITDPGLVTWYDKLGLEVADKCAWTFGTTYTAPNGALANFRTLGRDYLLQQLWVPTKNGGYCSMSAP